MAGERVAVVVWGGRISPVLDVAQRALLLDLAEGRVVGRRELALGEGNGEASLAELRRHGVTTLLCGAVSEELALRAAALGLELVPFLAGDVEDVVGAYLASRLPSDAFAMPGCGGRRRRRGEGPGELGGRWGVDDERRFDMPNRDGTGPQGHRGGSGRGLGPCGGGGGRPGGGRGAGGGGRGPGRGQGRGQGGGQGQGGGAQEGGRGPDRDA